jgi:protein TonB
MKTRISDRPQSHLRSFRKTALKIGFLFSISLTILAFKVPIHFEPVTLGNEDPFEDSFEWAGTEIVLEKEEQKVEVRKEKPPVFVPIFEPVDLTFEDDFPEIEPEDFDFGDEFIPEIADEKPVEPPLILEFAEVMPSFPGGESAMIRYFISHFEYPSIDIEVGNQGTAYISFVVGKNGKIRDIEFLRGVSRTIDKEIMRVLKGMPEWVPGSQRGEKVNVRYRWPINVKIS